MPPDHFSLVGRLPYKRSSAEDRRLLIKIPHRAEAWRCSVQSSGAGLVIVILSILSAVISFQPAYFVIPSDGSFLHLMLFFFFFCLFQLLSSVIIEVALDLCTGHVRALQGFQDCQKNDFDVTCQGYVADIVQIIF